MQEIIEFSATSLFGLLIAVPIVERLVQQYADAADIEFKRWEYDTFTKPAR